MMNLHMYMDGTVAILQIKSKELYSPYTAYIGVSMCKA